MGFKPASGYPQSTAITDLREMYVMLKALHLARKKLGLKPPPNVWIYGDGSCVVDVAETQQPFKTFKEATAYLDNLCTETEAAAALCPTCGGKKKLIGAVDGFAYTAHLITCPTCSPDVQRPVKPRRAILSSYMLQHDEEYMAWAGADRAWHIRADNPEGYSYAPGVEPYTEGL
jgi:hypothetical protein